MNVRRIRKVLAEARAILEVYSSRQGAHFRKDDLNCMCGISSYVLFLYFKGLNLRPTFCMNDYHCFIRLGEYWVDLTLTQFNSKCPSVWFRRRPYTKNDGYGNVHRAIQKARSIKKIRRLFRAWPHDQNPFKCKGLPKLQKAA